MDRSFPIPILSNKQRCPHMSLHLNCNVGGYATANCFHPSYHNECNFRQKAERRYESKGKEEKK